VLCPHPGCLHEEPSAELAALHAGACPAALGRGFRYVPAEEVAAALRQRALRQRAQLFLDADFGGCAGSAPMRCMCEIDDAAARLTFRELEEGRGMYRFSLQRCTGVHRGWQLDCDAQCTFERGAFPRTVDLVVFSGSYDHTYDYYTSRLSGWALCPCSSRRLLSEEAAALEGADADAVPPAAQATACPRGLRGRAQ